MPVEQYDFRSAEIVARAMNGFKEKRAVTRMRPVVPAEEFGRTLQAGKPQPVTEIIREVK